MLWSDVPAHHLYHWPVHLSDNAFDYRISIGWKKSQLTILLLIHKFKIDILFILLMNSLVG